MKWSPSAAPPHARSSWSLEPEAAARDLVDRRTPSQRELAAARRENLQLHGGTPEVLRRLGVTASPVPPAVRLRRAVARGRCPRAERRIVVLRLTSPPTLGESQPRTGGRRPACACAQHVRKPEVRRASPKARAEPRPGIDLAALAANATYVGSAEHKDHWSPTTGPGQAHKRSDATRCPKDPTGDNDLLTGWVREAIAAGFVTEPWEEGMYPQYAWLRVAGTVWMARAVNAQQGTYKGWQAAPGEAPEWLP